MIVVLVYFWSVKVVFSLELFYFQENALFNHYYCAKFHNFVHNLPVPNSYNLRTTKKFSFIFFSNYLQFCGHIELSNVERIPYFRCLVYINIRWHFKIILFNQNLLDKLEKH